MGFASNDHEEGALVAIQHESDQTSPVVNMVVPSDGATNQAVTSRVGITFTDSIDIRTVHIESIITPQGGLALPCSYSHQNGILNIWPDEQLDPATIYEVVVPAGGFVIGLAILLSKNSSSFTTSP